MDRFALPLSELPGPFLTPLQARRVQFRLQSAHECSQMVGVLGRRGMEFQQQRPRTGRPASARSEADEAGGRPLTTQTYSAKGTFGVAVVPPNRSPFHLQTLEAGGLSSQTPVHTRRITDTEKATLRQPSTAHTIDNVRPQAPSRAPTIDANYSMLASNQPGLGRNTAQDAQSGITHDLDNARRNQMTCSPARPTTGLYEPSAPASLRLPDTLESEMPPRRELPFKRPGSHQSGSSRPSTSAKSASHSTTGAGSSELTVTSSVLSPARNVSMQRPATASPLKRPIAPSHLEPTKKALAVEMRPQTQGSLLPSASSPLKPATASIHDGSFRRPSDLGELLRIAKPLAERSPESNKVVRLDSTADAQYELETPPGTSSSLSKTNAHTIDPIARASSFIQGPADCADSVALADYAAQSREDRQAVLDEFMVSKLEDPNFAVLCEDLDSCWRRIALGL